MHVHPRSFLHASQSLTQHQYPALCLASFALPVKMNVDNEKYGAGGPTYKGPNDEPIGEPLGAHSSIQAGETNALHKNLKGRHMQMIAMYAHNLFPLAQISPCSHVIAVVVLSVQVCSWARAAPSKLVDRLPSYSASSSSAA